VSPRLSSGFTATRLCAGALLLASLAHAAAAQSPPDEPFTSVVDGQSYLGNAPLRLWHRTRGYGEQSGETAFGTHWAAPFGENIGFIDGQFRLADDDTDYSMNAGAGFRWRADDFLTGYPRIFGFSFWYDGEDTENDNYFNQLGVSFERLGPRVDLRLNANIPLEDEKQGDDVTLTGATTYTGNDLAQATLVGTDIPLRVVDFEVAPRVFNFNAWVYGGGYQMDGDGISEFGWKGGARGYITNDLALDVGVTDDEEFGTNTVVQIIWTPGRTTPTASSWTHTIDDRMREQVFRNAYVATAQRLTPGAEVITNENGQRFDSVHVASNAAPGGDGTFERPYDELTDINPNTNPGAIILVHANSSFNGQSATVQDSQRLLGEGNNVQHTVLTAQLGTVNLPPSFAGALGAAKPIINNAGGAGAIILAAANTDVDAVDPIEVSNFTINGGLSGVVSPTGVGQANINHMSISNTTSHGINLTPLTETLTNNTMRQRFQTLLDDNTFTGVGGDDILLTSATPAVGTAILESSTISDTTSTGGNGYGVHLVNNQRTYNISNYTWDGDATGDGAIRSEGGVAGSNVVGSNITVREGQAGTGSAISLINSAATHTFTSTTVTDTGGASIVADGGLANMTFTGRITQANDQSVVSVLNGHDGTLTFNESTANQGVIEATNGNGLQFANADGSYIFNHKVTLNGGDAGIDVLAGNDAVNGSQGVFTFANADIDFNNSTAAAAAVAIDASTVQAFTISGDIDVTGGRPVAITNNKGGSMTFNATIDGMDEQIFVDGNSGGTTLFSGQVTMNTAANAAVVISDNTGGSTRFNNLDITTTTGNAYTAINSAAHTIEVAGADNTITTAGGLALHLDTVAIGAQNLNFRQVNATGGANGIVIEDTNGAGADIRGAHV
jgi:hypothetical protein